ncbi:GntR family transcriptional regulator [Roseinatronobacter alkalisoli]|uniref:GntR family transcriptional regulator n=1 Tax=Roseinatronobacter alkalisoli TaxID=3028235 RepID=A0ABT5TCT2_9RHOB|nr:GntR family transcriptional regulator [Roseinatronobacter sp. HJB301]MDD7972937.1 GntR family transcriptional regulator [Roseinatronobacter sp. HJB301]
MKLRELAYDAFTENLLSRQISPGQFISQRELVALTGMNLGAVREMIPRLEADGLIRSVPQRGLQVMHVDMELIRNAFQLRIMLEREAVRHFVTVVSDAEIAALRADHEAARAAAASGITPDILAQAQQTDWDFHDRMIDMLGNDLIRTIYRTNAIKVRLIRNEDTRMLPELAVSVMDEHLAIIAAIESRDPEAAENALLAHLTSARQRAVRI